VKNLKIGLRQYMFLLAALVLAGCSSSSDDQQVTADEPATEMSAAPAELDLAGMLASESRSEADRARDAGRKPAEVLAFLGVEKGMSAIDIIAAGGYYTEVLSLAVGPDGHVTAQNPAFVLEMREGANEKALTERLADSRLANVSRLNKEVIDIAVDDGLFDIAITALNFHDIYNSSGEETAVGVMKVVFAVLKPGGIFGVIDHQGVDGNDNKAMHRALTVDVIRTAEAAGFILVDSSGLLHTDDDMTQAVFAEGVRGQTNRFLIKLQRPAE